MSLQKVSLPTPELVNEVNEASLSVLRLDSHAVNVSAILDQTRHASGGGKKLNDYLFSTDI